MEIKQAVFEISAVKPDHYPVDALPAIAMVGRSNVGKSSCINALCSRKSLARTSSEPGKTRLINFYRINDVFYLVDLPGYGYAKASKGEQAGWGPMMERFFDGYPALAGLMQLVDVRHAPTRQDIETCQWLQGYGIPLVVLANKVDKLGKSQVKPRLREIRASLGCHENVPILPFSAPKRQGVEEVLAFLDTVIPG